jgi:ADP-ribose pyrophosphatase YjhB (NUDIX family)
MKPFVGKVPGFEYEVKAQHGASCHFCGRVDLPLLRSASDLSSKGICEPCAVLVSWAWRQSQGELVPDAAYPLDVHFVLVLIVRERLNDYLHPFDVLMVERKDEPEAYGLPGGKVEQGETPAEAAARELEEEVDIRTWPAALETLHTAYSPRASLGTVFLCRGYDGDVVDGVGPEGQKVRWQPWPPGAHARHLAGFYTGVEVAFDMRWRMHRSVQAGTPLSLRLGEPAVNYLLRKQAQLRGDRKLDDGRMLESWSNVMTEEEKGITGTILHVEQKLADARAGVASLEAAKAVAVSAGVIGGEDEPEEEGEEDDNAVEGLEVEAGQRDLGFVRPPLPKRPPS